MALAAYLRDVYVLLLAMRIVSTVPDLSKLTPWNSGNIWVTLMKELNQTTFCASLAYLEHPFHTCLVGILLNGTEASLLVRNVTRLCNLLKKECDNIHSCIKNINSWDNTLPISTSLQEVDILGSLSAESCLYFNYRVGHDNEKPSGIVVVRDASPDSAFYKNESFWCKHVGRN